MKNLNILTLVLLCVCAKPCNAATFLLDFAIGELSGLTDGVSKAILVADTGNNGFRGISTSAEDIASFSLTTGSFAGDDLVLAVMTAEDLGSSQFGFEFSGTSFNTSVGWGAWAPGQKLGVYWFGSGSNAVGQGFGFYRTDSVEDGTIGYVTPVDGTYSLASATTSLGGTGFAESPTIGTIGVIPEPSRMVLLGIAGLLACMRRRR